MNQPANQPTENKQNRFAALDQKVADDRNAEAQANVNQPGQDMPGQDQKQGQKQQDQKQGQDLKPGNTDPNNGKQDDKSNRPS